MVDVDRFDIILDLPYLSDSAKTFWKSSIFFVETPFLRNLTGVYLHGLLLHPVFIRPHQFAKNKSAQVGKQINNV